MGFRSRRTPDVGDLIRRRDVAVLFEIAGDLDASARKAAIAGLAEIGPGEAVPAAIEALGNRSERVRCAAIRFLHHEREAVPLAEAVSWLPAGSPSRALALAAVAELDAPEAAAMLARSLVHGRAQEGLWEEEVALVVGLCRSGHDSTACDEVVDVLTEALEDEQDEVAGRAEDFLLWLGEYAAPALIAHADSSPAPCRAVRILGQIGGTAALESLIRAVEHADPATREQACAALGTLRDPVSVEALLRATRDPEHGVRVKAAVALDRIGTAALVASLSATVASQIETAKPRPRLAPAPDNTSADQAPASRKARTSARRRIT